MKRLYLLLMLVMPAAAFADETEKILACVSANAPPTVRIQQIELSSTDRSGSRRSFTGKLYAKSETSSAGSLLRIQLRLEQPADVAGTAYLVREAEDEQQDGMFVYLPAVKRVRRVSGGAADATLLGTNFSYNDFRQMQTAFVDASSLFEEVEKVNNRPAYVLSVTPTIDAKTRYSSIRIWIDQQTCVPIKSEFREGMSVIKEFSVPVTALQKSSNRWYASEMHMRDLTDGTSSVLRILGTVAGANIPESYFDPTSFFQGQ